MSNYTERSLTAKRVPNTELSENHDGFLIELDFPVVPIHEYAASSAEISTICKSINVTSLDEIHKTTTSDDLLVVLPSWEAVVEIEPNFVEIEKGPGRGIIVTGLAPIGSGFNFFSRFFCPKLGVDEFDALVAALPLSEGGEEAQLNRIVDLQAENDAVGQELQKQLEAAEKELKQVYELFGQAADYCFNLKKPD